ncbi:MAG: 30S ribosomal protein S8 [Candidatus Zambryskibacteria bacterium]|nr:30S ribosomal protein S8 [Candidatus Zambryskibacteria bacterium]
MDQISNFIIQIKNAGNAGHESVASTYSKLRHSIALVLKKEGFVKDVEVKMEGGRKALVVTLLKGENRVPKIQGVERISKPSKRIYKKSSEMRAVRSGYGALIVSTSAGVMSGRDAKAAKLGGEALFNIW